MVGVLSGYKSLLALFCTLSSLLDRSVRSVALKKIQSNSSISGAIKEYRAEAPIGFHDILQPVANSFSIFVQTI
jgi:hypothetical protein